MDGVILPKEMLKKKKAGYKLNPAFDTHPQEPQCVLGEKGGQYSTCLESF